MQGGTYHSPTVREEGKRKRARLRFRNQLTSPGTKHWFCSLVVRSICSPVHCTVARFVSAVQAKCNFRFNRRIGSIKLICCQRGGGGQQPMVVFNVYRITRVEWWSITTLTPRLTLVILCRHICQTPALNNILTFCTFCNWLVIWKKHSQWLSPPVKEKTRIEIFASIGSNNTCPRWRTDLSR